MIPIFRNIEDAKQFFLSNSSGECKLVDANGKWLVVNCYQDAVSFFG